MLKAVLDTNVFISSLLNKKGTPAKLLDMWKDGQYLLISSPRIIHEIKSVLELPRIKIKYCLDDLEIQKLINVLETDAILVPGSTEIENVIPDDPSDQMFLACAVECGADVSGDRHLLELKEFEGIAIITVNEFISLLSRPVS